MTCKKCGAELSENAKFCAECGEAVEVSSEDESATTSDIKPIDKSESNEESLSEQFVPTVLPSEVHMLSRDQTLELMCQLRDIAKEAEICDKEVVRAANRVDESKKELENLRNKTPGAGFVAFISVVIAIIIVFAAKNIFLAIAGLIVAFIVTLIIYSVYVKKNHLMEEIKRVADEYEINHLKPLETKFDEKVQEREALLKSGKIQWAKEIIGEDMFFSDIISALYDLIISRRADSLKEALNKFDDELHKQQMEQMQRSIQEEAIKQTAKIGQIASNTRQVAANTEQAAQAARLSAAANYATYKNIKSINKKLR